MIVIKILVLCCRLDYCHTFGHSNWMARNMVRLFPMRLISPGISPQSKLRLVLCPKSFHSRIAYVYPPNWILYSLGQFQRELVCISFLLCGGIYLYTTPSHITHIILNFSNLIQWVGVSILVIFYHPLFFCTCMQSSPPWTCTCTQLIYSFNGLNKLRLCDITSTWDPSCLGWSTSSTESTSFYLNQGSISQKNTSKWVCTSFEVE